MKSNWCKSEEHAGCAVHGAMRSPSGKSFRCKCPCHPAPKRPRPKRDDDDDEQE